MPYLVPASDVHDRLDQVVVPSVGNDANPTRKAVQGNRCQEEQRPSAQVIASSDGTFLQGETST